MYGIESIKKLNEATGQPAVYEKQLQLSDTVALDRDEIHEVKRILAKVKEEEAKAAGIDHYEKLASLRSRTRYVLKGVLDRCRALKEYREADYVRYKLVRPPHSLAMSSDDAQKFVGPWNGWIAG